MENVNIILAFSAGVLSFLSPCILPLIPAYITYLTGMSIEEINSGKDKITIVKKSLGFILGFSIIFILMGVSISSVGKVLSNNRDVFRKVGGILIIIFGLHTMGILKIKTLYREGRVLNMRKAEGTFGAIVLGMAFATGWTPCIGPILSSILIYAGSVDSVSKGVLLLVFYSLGMAIPFFLTALLIQKLSVYLKRIYKYFPVISFISGAVLILMGIMIFTNKLTMLNNYLNF
ncbi:cytochrome c biogenesis CcdA family protein [Haloimpatiens lingqiaonensis]|uniref:cytochrome c biogenesis CcdA family protein n=1 Tax=Haloimpatiens lingqiaonensis TaxID=1380675 RepID=UPI0010FDD04E|nr:cytochrome c biogenesis protein CcdA [Haloimpatiens lingqiaonensis]